VKPDDMETVESDGLVDSDRSGVEFRRPEPGAVSADWRQLGTDIRVVVTEPVALATAQQLVYEELCALDLACSRFRTDSELVSIVEAAGGQPTRISPLLADAIAVALAAAEATNGEVDPTVGEAMNEIGYDRDFQFIDRGVGLTVRSRPAPGWRRIELNLDARTVRVPVGVRLDLGATAKALSADRAAIAVAAHVGCGVLVSLGGDVCVAGPAPQGGWQIRVQDVTGNPTADPIGSHSTVTITTGALATSSTAARRWVRGGNPMHHIIDPRIGLPAVSPWRTVSVAASTCVDANTASTAAIVRGEKALAWLDSLQLPARLVRHDGTVCTVAGWPADGQVSA
jgi:thiamine biosynthesis lipoprotein ApbE